MLRQALALILCAALVTTGCASATGPRFAQAPAAPVATAASRPPADPTLAGYVQQLPAGSKLRVERANGPMLRGTLMKATGDTLVMQKNTRVPEAPVEVPLADVTRVTLDTPGPSLGKSIAIGVGVGVAATFGVLWLIFATIDD